MNWPTAERVRELLDYNPETGEFTWKASKSNRAKNGSRAGYLNKLGYIRIRVDDALYMASRLAWLYIYGVWPAKHIDHVNGATTDNRIANLREVDDRQNGANSKRRKNNTTGFKGVHKHQDKWQAAITVNRKTIYLGRFATPVAAHEAYCAAAKQYFGEYARTE